MLSDSLRRIAFVLLVVLPASVLAWTLLPPEATAAVASVWFPVLLLGLSLSLVVSVAARLHRLVRPRRIPEAPEACASVEGPIPPALLLSTAEQVYRGRVVLRRERQGGTESVLVRGRAGIWGSLLFHAGIVAVLAGAATGILCGFEGSVLLTEGERVRFGAQPLPHLRAGMLAPRPDANRFDIRLDRFEDRRPVGNAFAPASVATCTAGDASEVLDIRINNGRTFRGIRLHQSDNWGYSPEVRLLRDGRTLLRAFVRLASPKHPADGLGRDHVTLTDGTVVDLTLQAASTGGGYGAHETAGGPTLIIGVRPPDGTRREFRLAPGAGARIGSVAAAFPSLRKWTQLDVSHDPGVPLLTAGCALALLGLALRLLFVRQTIWLRVTTQGVGARLTVSGKTERYPAAFRATLVQNADQLRAAIPQLSATSPAALLPV